MDHPFQFRPGTHDEGIFYSVCEANEYRLPEAFRPDDIIIDVGMHIGSFCYAALRRGSNHVHGFEAELSNYESAVRNLRPFGNRVSLHHKAVWRSDRDVHSLRFFGSSDGANTGGGNVVFAVGECEVEAIPFDEVILAVTDGGRKRVRLLKIDCEGSEFPILLTSLNLHMIDQIIGEFHELGGDYDPHKVLPEGTRVPGFERFTIVELSDVLRRAGFDVIWERPPEKNIGLFFASRRIPPYVRFARRAVSVARRAFPRTNPSVVLK